MALQANFKTFKYNSKSKVYHYMYNEKEAIVKDRFISIDNNMNNCMLQIMKVQTAIEAKAILKCKMNGILVPTLYLIDLKNCKIIMEKIHGLTVHDFLKNNYNNTSAIIDVLLNIGAIINEMHESNISHGSLNTFNMLLKENGSIVLINFGLSCLNPSVNEKIMDLYILEKFFISVHWQIADKFCLIVTGYKDIHITNNTHILKTASMVSLYFISILIK